jgi:DNA repair exonuclease SbcCD ATPase subunit
MPNFEAFNADGDPIEGVLPPEEIKSLQEKLNETNAKLEKLENKEFNFRKLEQMTDEQKAKLTDTELSLKKQQEELEEKQKSFESTFVKDIKGDLLTEMAGDDEELKKKIELNYSRIKDSETAKSRSEIKAILNDAYVMSVGARHKNPVLSAINSSGSPAAKSEKVSDDLMSLASKFGLSAEDLNKSK